MKATPTPQELLDRLKTIKYPGYSRDIVSFGIVRDIEVGSTAVIVTLAPSSPSQEVIERIRHEVGEALRAATDLTVQITMQAPEAPRARGPQTPAPVPGVRRIIAVASGKGGVGKSTVATNLALALHALGHRVGLLDADVFGPSVPLMLGLTERPVSTDDKRILPPQRYGIKAISIGMFVGEMTPIIWRGPMISKLLTQFLREVEWGELDYLVLDLPPGTGDAQLTITQQVALSGGVIVTTPQDVALLDVKRGVAMFEQVNTPVLGVIENMSYHLCPGCGHRTDLFGAGGGEAVARQFGIPLLGEVPLVRAIREAGDAGAPIVVADCRHPQSQVFLAIAKRVIDEVEARAAEPLPVVR